MFAATGSSRSDVPTAPRPRCPNIWPSSKRSRSATPSSPKSARAITRSASPPMWKRTARNCFKNCFESCCDPKRWTKASASRNDQGEGGMSAMVKSIDADTAEAQRELTDGFHLLIDALKLNGVSTIYGVPGIPITDLGRMAQAEGIRVISFRHEQNAGNAAAIAGFLTRKPGV